MTKNHLILGAWRSGTLYIACGTKIERGRNGDDPDAIVNASDAKDWRRLLKADPESKLVPLCTRCRRTFDKFRMIDVRDRS